MKRSNVLGLSVVALGVGLAAPAYSDGLNYTYVEGGYIATDIDDLDVDGDGLGIAGSAAIGSNWFVHGAYGNQDFDAGVDLDQLEVGIGGHMPLMDQVDLVGTLSYINAEIDTPFGNVDDDGFGASVGLRGRIAPQVELEGSISYVDFDEGGDDTAFNVDGRYYFTENFAVGAGASFSDDATTWTLGARFEF